MVLTVFSVENKKKINFDDTPKNQIDKKKFKLNETKDLYHVYNFRG